MPETTILGLGPGDVFAHRNIANILTSEDLSSISVIEFAVVYLKVKHVVICGHTGCGGVAAAMGDKKLGRIDAWLSGLRELREENKALLESLPEEERAPRLVELNVAKSMDVIRQNPDVVKAAKERGLLVHGLVHDLSSGKLKRLDL